MRIIFWNTHKNKKINSILCDIMEEHRIDIAVLAEYEDDSQKFIQELSGQGIQMEQYMTSGCERIVMFGSRKGMMPAKINIILCSLWMGSISYAGYIYPARFMRTIRREGIL